MVLDSLLQKFPEQMDPLTWLWIQLYPRYMLKCEEREVDGLLGHLVKKLIRANLPPNLVEDALEDRMSKIEEQLGLSDHPPCFVDEAQVLLTTRSEVSRVGKECISSVRFRLQQYH